MQLKEKESREELKEEIGRAKEEIEEKADSLLRETFPKEEILLDETLPPLKDTPSMGGKMPGWKGSEVVIRHPLYVVGIDWLLYNEIGGFNLRLVGGLGLHEYLVRLQVPMEVKPTAVWRLHGGYGIVLSARDRFYKVLVREGVKGNVDVELYRGENLPNGSTVEVLVGWAFIYLENSSLRAYGVGGDIVEEDEEWKSDGTDVGIYLGSGFRLLLPSNSSK